MSISNTDKASDTDNIDAPYTSSLLRYNTQLKATAALLTTMCAVLHYVTTSERSSLQALIDSAKTLHDGARFELENVFKKVESVIRADYLKPNRILEDNNSRDIVEDELVSLGRAMADLKFKADELEQKRKIFLRKWEVEAEGVE